MRQTLGTPQSLTSHSHTSSCATLFDLLFKMKANYSHQIRAQFLSRKSRRSEYQNLIKSSFHPPSRFSCTRDPRGLQTRQEGCKGESGYTSREESYFKPHSSSNPLQRDSRVPGGVAVRVRRLRTFPGSVETTTCSPLNMRPLTAAGDSPPRPAPGARVPGDAHPHPPPARALPEVQEAHQRLPRTSPPGPLPPS